MNAAKASADANEESFNRFAGAMGNLEDLAEDTNLNIVDLENFLEVLDFEVN